MRPEQVPSSLVDRCLMVGACCILLLAVLGKSAALLSNLNILAMPDPIFLVGRRYVLAAMVPLECAVVVALLTSRRVWVKGLVLVWLGGNFALYRIALYLTDARVPCPCFGNLGAPLGLKSSAVDILSKGAIAYLMASGVYLLLSDRSKSRLEAEAVGASEGSRNELGPGRPQWHTASATAGQVVVMHSNRRVR